MEIEMKLQVIYIHLYNVFSWIEVLHFFRVYHGNRQPPLIKQYRNTLQATKPFFIYDSGHDNRKEWKNIIYGCLDEMDNYDYVWQTSYCWTGEQRWRRLFTYYISDIDKICTIFNFAVWVNIFKSSVGFFCFLPAAYAFVNASALAVNLHVQACQNR